MSSLQSPYELMSEPRSAVFNNFSVFSVSVRVVHLFCSHDIFAFLMFKCSSFGTFFFHFYQKSFHIIATFCQWDGIICISYFVDVSSTNFHSFWVWPSFSYVLHTNWIGRKYAPLFNPLPTRNHSIYILSLKWFPVHNTSYVPGQSSAEARPSLLEQPKALHDQRSQRLYCTLSKRLTFYNSSELSNTHWMLTVRSRVPLPFLYPAWTPSISCSI